MVTALMNSEKPRPALARRNGAAGTNPPTRKAKVPMAVSVRDGRVRPHLVVAGKDSPGIEVSREINVEALASALDAVLNGTTPVDEVTFVEAITAAAFARGIEFERSMAGVA